MINHCLSCGGSRHVCRFCGAGWVADSFFGPGRHSCGERRHGWKKGKPVRRQRLSRIACSSHTQSTYVCDGGCGGTALSCSQVRYAFGKPDALCEIRVGDAKLHFCRGCEVRFEMAKDWAMGAALVRDDSPLGLYVERLESALCGQAFEHARESGSYARAASALWAARSALTNCLKELTDIGVSTGETVQVCAQGERALHAIRLAEAA